MNARMLLALAAPLLVASQASAQAPTKVGLWYEALDGHVQDLCGPTDASVAPQNKRVWIAQGRVRAAIRISDRARQFGEDRTFDSSDHPENREEIVAVELDELNQRLYTLTKRALYRESVVDATQPGPAIVFDFNDATPVAPEQNVADWEPVVDLKLWPEDGAIFVLTGKRVIILQDTGSQFVVRGWTPDMYDPNGEKGAKLLPAPHCDSFNVPALKVKTFERLRVGEDEPGGEVMAYVTANMAGYSDPGYGRPLPSLVIACFLDDSNGYASPTFDLNTGVRINYAVWNPMPSLPAVPAPAGEKSADYTIYSLDAFAIGSDRYLYLACGKLNQVKRIAVTGSYPRNCSSPAWAPDPAYVLNNAWNVFNVLADGLMPTRFLALVGPTGPVFAYDTLTGAKVTTPAEEGFGFGCHRDMVQIALPAPVTKSLWTGVDQLSDYIHKVVDVSSNTALPLVDEYFGISTSDGAVAIGTNIYTPTWGGVVRYELLPGLVWQAVPSSYKPAEVPPDSGNLSITEHIDTGMVDGVHRLFTTPATGDLMEFKIDGAGNPQFPARYFVDATLLPTAWNYGIPGPFFDNDVAFVSLGSLDEQKFVLMDLTDHFVAGATMQPALLAYKWFPIAPEWRHVASALASRFDLTQDKVEFTNTITLADGTGGKRFAIVAHSLGFFTVDITSLTNATPQMWVVDERCSDLSDTVPDCSQGKPILGLATSMDRIFVYVNESPPSIRVYGWNPGTGEIGSLLNTAADTSFQPPSPTPVGRAFRGRFHATGPLPGEGYAYFACAPYVLQLRWLPTAPDVLTLTRWWESDYEHEYQDCRFYDIPGVGPGILASKNWEAFAFIKEQ